MALVVLLRAVNVGGHHRFRPAVVARELSQYQMVNIGAAGTFVVIGAVTPETIRSEVLIRLGFSTTVIICEGRDLVRFAEDDPFAGVSESGAVRFVTVMAEPSSGIGGIPMSFPAVDDWQMKIWASAISSPSASISGK